MARKNTEPIAIGDHLQTFTNDEHLKQETSKSKGVIAICDNLPQNAVETRILTIRGAQVMLDRDLAELYGVPTYRLNEQVKRNIKRFPERFRFQLTSEEIKGLIANNDRLSSLQYNPSKPYAYSEQGVAMLSSVLHSDDAIEISIRIMDAFVAMRHFLLSNAQVFQRLDRIEYKQIEADHRIEELFRKIDERSITPKQGIFFDGQIYDAYEFICGLIKSAMKRIVLIDNYVDETVLTMLDKRKSGVSATIYTQKLSQAFQLDISKHNAQYPIIEVIEFKKSHDRFLMIDDKVYLVGASLKDLGKKWFAVCLMSETSPEVLLLKL